MHRVLQQVENWMYVGNYKQYLNFLHSLKCKGLSYSKVNAAWSSLSTFTNVEGHDVDKHPLVQSLYERTSRPYPSTVLHGIWVLLCGYYKVPKYTHKWLIVWFVNLSGKLTTLLVVLSGQRAREVLTVIDLKISPLKIIYLSFE